MELQQVVAQAGKLYTLPDICLQLRQLSGDGQSSAPEISRLVSTDTALAARLLKLANSPLYGFSSKISNLSRAITLVGVKEMNNLALATSAAGMFGGVGGSYIDIRQFWRHSVITGLMMSVMAEKLKAAGGEELFLVGLLHNIGKLVVLEQVAHFAGTACEVANPDQLLWEREREVLGYTFAEVGAALMEAWSMPEALVVPMTWQHQPLQARTQPLPSILLHIALNWVGSHSMEGGSGGYLTSIEPPVMELSGLGVNDVEAIFGETLDRSPEVLSVFS